MAQIAYVDEEDEGGDDKEDENEAEEQWLDKGAIENEEDVTNKLQALTKSNDETRAALPPLARPKNRERRARREVADGQGQETNVGKIFPVTPQTQITYRCHKLQSLKQGKNICIFFIGFLLLFFIIGFERIIALLLVAHSYENALLRGTKQ